MTGLLLFLRYASPCIEFQTRKGNIEPKDRDRLLAHLENNTSPSRRIMRRCFKGAVAGYHRTCKKMGIPADFSLGSVAHHWRYNHGHEGRCAVKFGEVEAVHPNMTIAKTESGLAQSYTFLNPFWEDSTWVGDLVTVHHLTVIENISAIVRQR
jgi:hypothetical protein